MWNPYFLYTFILTLSAFGNIELTSQKVYCINACLYTLNIDIVHMSKFTHTCLCTPGQTPTFISIKNVNSCSMLLWRCQHRVMDLY